MLSWAVFAMAFLNGVGVFGVYMQSKVKAAFTVLELFDHAITAALYLLRF